jgi:hypothetical protein
MSIYEILPALDLTQSVHAKISIGMHRVFKSPLFKSTEKNIENTYKTDKYMQKLPREKHVEVKYSRGSIFFHYRWLIDWTLKLYRLQPVGKPHTDSVPPTMQSQIPKSRDVTLFFFRHDALQVLFHLVKESIFSAIFFYNISSAAVSRVPTLISSKRYHKYTFSRVSHVTTKYFWVFS